MRVLIFEDNYDIEAMLVSGGISTRDMTIEQRWDSSDALDHIKRFQPNVLLLDHFMPPITGYEVLKRLLASNHPRPTTVIAISSEASKNKAMVNLGADESIIKFDVHALACWS